MDGELIARAEGSPLLKVDLQLVASEACFEPPLSGSAVPSVGAAFAEWLQSFLDTGALVARLDSGTGRACVLLTKFNVFWPASILDQVRLVHCRQTSCFFGLP